MGLLPTTTIKGHVSWLHFPDASISYICLTHTITSKCFKIRPKNSTGLKKNVSSWKGREGKHNFAFDSTHCCTFEVTSCLVLTSSQRPELRFVYHLFIIDSTHCCSFDVISCLARTSSKARIKTQNAEHGNLNLAQSTINSSYILAMLWICLKVFSNMNSLHTSWSPR